MFTYFRDASLFKYDDTILFAECADPVCNRDRRATLSRWSRASWISRSVSVSTDDVASSRMRMRGSVRKCACNGECVAARHRIGLDRVRRQLSRNHPGAGG